MHSVLRPLLFILLGLSLSVSAQENRSAASKTPDSNPRVLIETSLGELTIELYPEKAPMTVANFLQYVDSGFYKDTIFHRVIPNFMIQGGQMTENFTPKEARPPIMNESSNGLRNLRGTLAMARTMDPNSAAAQFFINLVDNPHLDRRPGSAGYAVFGKVVDGMDTVDRIGKVRTSSKQGHRDVPVEPVIIKKATRQ